jgi:hypothetical protein
MGLGPGARGYRRNNASADPADGGGLAAQITGSTDDAMGRDYTDPALPVGHEPMGDPPKPADISSQGTFPSAGTSSFALKLPKQRKACWLRGRNGSSLHGHDALRRSGYPAGCCAQRIPEGDLKEGAACS